MVEIIDFDLLSPQEALNFIESKLIEKTGKRLTDTQRAVFLSTWSPDIDYQAIAERTNKTRAGVGAAARNMYKLFEQSISRAGKIGHKNFRGAIIQFLQQEGFFNTNSQITNNIFDIREVKINENSSFNNTASKQVDLEPPNLPVPLNSRFYITRKGEDFEYKIIETPGAVIRIIGTRRSGCTSLANRIVARAEKNGDRSVFINFQGVDKKKLSSIESFMQWFCTAVSSQLDLNFQEYLDNDWDDDTPNLSCTEYFEKHLLKELPESIVIVFDRIDYFFTPSINGRVNSEGFEAIDLQLQTAQNFFALIRTWMDAKSTRAIWDKAKYIIIQGDREIEMSDRGSPFNVGHPITLKNFFTPEIIDLAARHQITWSSIETEKLNKIFGENSGHPYLIRNLLYYLVRENLSLEEFLKLDLKHIAPFKTYLA